MGPGDAEILDKAADRCQLLWAGASCVPRILASWGSWNWHWGAERFCLMLSKFVLLTWHRRTRSLIDVKRDSSLI
jgi:hypothetical protein